MSKEDLDTHDSGPPRSPHIGADGEVCFNLTALINELHATEEEKTALMREKGKLVHLLQSDDGVDKLFNNSLTRFREVMRRLFSKRWQEIVLTGDALTVADSILSRFWDSLATNLCDGDLFTCKPRELLMPSINWQKVDVVDLETKMLDVPLNKLIIADDGKNVIRIDAVVANAEVNNGVLVVWSEAGDREFSIAEIKRFAATNEALWRRYLTLFNEHAKDKGFLVSKPTIIKLAQLIEQSVFKAGETGSYDATQQKRSEEAYYAFLEFLNIITEEEKEHLMRQVIRRFCYAQGFKNLWALAMNDGACITILAKDICQLILDYDPEHEFVNETIQNWVTQLKMRDQTQRKVYSTRNPFKHFSSVEEYYKQKLLRLGAVILREDFNLGGFAGGKSANLFGIRNTVTTTAESMLDTIKRALHGTKSYMASYVQIHHEILQAALNAPRPFTRHDKTQEWLTTIYFERIYLNQSLTVRANLAIALEMLKISESMGGSSEEITTLKEEIFFQAIMDGNEGHFRTKCEFKAFYLMGKAEEFFKLQLAALCDHKPEKQSEKIKSRYTAKITLLFDKMQGKVADRAINEFIILNFLKKLAIEIWVGYVPFFRSPVYIEVDVDKKLFVSRALAYMKGKAFTGYDLLMHTYAMLVRHKIEPEMLTLGKNLILKYTGYNATELSAFNVESLEEAYSEEDGLSILRAAVSAS